MSTDTVSMLPTTKTTAPIASTCVAKIWAKTTICQTGRQHPMPRQAPNNIHSRGNQNIFILCPGSGLHNAHRPQCDCQKKATPTEQIKQFLDYAATNPDAILTYQASDMILIAHSNASYLSEPKALSQAGGQVFMSTSTAFPPKNGGPSCPWLQKWK